MAVVAVALIGFWVGWEAAPRELVDTRYVNGDSLKGLQYREAEVIRCAGDPTCDADDKWRELYLRYMTIECRRPDGTVGLCPDPGFTDRNED